MVRNLKLLKNFETSFPDSLPVDTDNSMTHSLSTVYIIGHFHNLFTYNNKLTLTSRMNPSWMNCNHPLLCA